MTKRSMVFDVETDPIVGPFYRAGAADMLRDLLKMKFGPVPAWVENYVAVTPPRQLRALARRLLKSSTLEQLFFGIKPEKVKSKKSTS